MAIKSAIVGILMLLALLLVVSTSTVKPVQPPLALQDDSLSLTDETTKIPTRVLHEKVETVISSLSGSQVDAANIFVVDGTIMIDQSLRFYYEYFLSLQGEMSEGKISLLLVRDANIRYPSLVANYVIELFQRYKNYLQQSNELLVASNANRDLSVLEQQDLAGSMQSTMFNEVERSVLFDNAFLELNADDYNPQGAYAHFKDLQRQLPLADIEVLRVENFGVEVASRFTILDEKRGLWLQRLNDYQCEKNEINESEGLHAMDKAQSIESLQHRSFSIVEIHRLQALERNNMLEPMRACG